MKMKLTKHQQEMLDGKHGEDKAFCMDKLVDFGKAVEAEEMVDLVLTLNGVPIWAKDRRTPEMMKKLAIYDLGHSALYDPLFAMKDGDQADRLLRLARHERPDDAPDGLYAGIADARGRVQGQDAKERRTVHGEDG